MKAKPISLKLKISNNFLVFLIYILSIGDYIVTYWGIHTLKVITEANPLMIKYMKLPLSVGLFLRCIIIFIPLFLLKCVEGKFKKEKNFKLVLLVILSIQIFPYVLHIIWISSYFT